MPVLVKGSLQLYLQLGIELVSNASLSVAGAERTELFSSRGRGPATQLQRSKVRSLGEPSHRCSFDAHQGADRAGRPMQTRCSAVHRQPCSGFV
jgi:hypothetical protein